jgi:Flp pilus assembly protein TadB
MGAVLLAALGIALLVYGLALGSGRRHRRSWLIRRYGAERGAPRSRTSVLSERLARVPLTRRLSPHLFRQVQWALAAAALAVAAWRPLLSGAPVPWFQLVAYPALAWALPACWLLLESRRTLRSLGRCFPDLLAHLVIQAEAGSSTLQALQTAPPVLREPLRGEVERLLTDLHVSPFPAALRRFAERTKRPEISRFAESLIYQQSRGISLRQILAEEETHMLAMARQDLRRRIQAGAVAMAAVTAILLLNALFVYLTPFAYEWLRLLSRAH